MDDHPILSNLPPNERQEIPQPEKSDNGKRDGDMIFYVNFAPTLPEKDYKRLVRSQAMKAYHAKKRRKAASEAEAEAHLRRADSLDSGRMVSRYSQDPFVNFPVNVTPQSGELLCNVFSDPRAVVETYRQVQLSNGLNCDASFYQTLANLANWIRVVGGTSDGMKKYMYQQEIQHTTRALSLVRGMLSNPKQQLSQGVISAITHLLNYAIMNNDMKAAAHHLGGLELIINLRGGFGTLDYDIQSCISWAEVFLATTWDTKPRFIAPSGFYQQVTSLDVPLTSGTLSVVANIGQYYPSLAPLMDLFEQVTRVNQLFKNDILHRRALNSGDLNLQNGIFYHLTSLTQPIETFENDEIILGEIVRLALLIYLLPTWRYVARLSSTAYDAAPRLRKFRHMFEHNHIDWSKLMHLKPWVVVMGFVHATEPDDIHFWTKVWHDVLCELEISHLLHDVDQIALSSCPDSVPTGRLSLKVPKVVTAVIWLEEFHGRRYEEIAERLVSYS